MKRYMKLVQIQGKLAFRCPDSIIFGVGMPVGILLLIGLIAGSKPAFHGADYTFLQSAFGSLVAVGICACAFMGVPLGIAEYRDKKILKHFFTTPVSPKVLLTVQVLINVFLAVVSAVFVSVIAIIFFGYEMKGSVLSFIGAYVLLLGSMFSLGMFLASICPNLKIANVVCTVVYFPMLFLSGATIPFELFPEKLQNVASVLPLTQGIKLLKSCSTGETIGDINTSIIILVGVLVVGVVGAFATFKWE